MLESFLTLAALELALVMAIYFSASGIIHSFFGTNDPFGFFSSFSFFGSYAKDWLYFLV
jgi:hypothetical protein